MKRYSRFHGFTFAETMIAMAASIIVVSGLFTGSIALQRTSCNADRYVSNQSDQRLLLDYLARDLRRAIGIAANVGGAGDLKLDSGSVSIEIQSDLIVALPAYYKSHAPNDADFDQPLPVIASGDRIAYGTEAGPAANITVTFRKLFFASEGCVCFVRYEAGVPHVIMRNADDLHIRVTVAADGKTCVIDGWFQSSFGRERPSIAAYDLVMLRNLRVD